MQEERLVAQSYAPGIMPSEADLWHLKTTSTNAAVDPLAQRPVTLPELVSLHIGVRGGKNLFRVGIGWNWVGWWNGTVMGWPGNQAWEGNKGWDGNQAWEGRRFGGSTCQILNALFLFFLKPAPCAGSKDFSF